MPEFTADWFTDKLPTWERHLLPLSRQPLNCLEIGSFEGRSALWMVEHVLQHPESRITCVDPLPSERTRLRFLHNTADAKRAGKLRLIQLPSSAALRGMVERFDFIYIDGSHHGADVLTDSVLAWLLLKDGGLLAWDDYLWRPPLEPARSDPAACPRPAIDICLGLWHGRYERLDSVKQQVWIRKNP